MTEKKRKKSVSHNMPQFQTADHTLYISPVEDVFTESIFLQPAQRGEIILAWIQERGYPNPITLWTIVIESNCKTDLYTQLMTKYNLMSSLLVQPHGGIKCEIFYIKTRNPFKKNKKFRVTEKI